MRGKAWGRGRPFARMAEKGRVMGDERRHLHCGSRAEGEGEGEDDELHSAGVLQQSHVVDLVLK